MLPSDRQVERQSSLSSSASTANKDGVVSLAEFMAQADRNFARCDTNKDGRTDTAECRQALQRPPATHARRVAMHPSCYENGSPRAGASEPYALRHDSA